MDVQFDGLFFEDAGYILPEELCEFLIDSPKINLLLLLIEKLSKNKNKINMKIGDKEYEYKNVCVCAGSETGKIVDINGMSSKRGQVTHIESLDSVSKIKLPICAKGYISPRINNIHLVGSSYSDIRSTDLSEEEHLYNLNNLKLIIDENMNIVLAKLA